MVSSRAKSKPWTISLREQISDAIRFSTCPESCGLVTLRPEAAISSCCTLLIHRSRIRDSAPPSGLVLVDILRINSL